MPDLHTHLGAVLEGMLVDAETAMPVTGSATIQVYSGDSIDYQSQRAPFWTEQNGHFRYRTPPGKLLLLVNDPPYGYLRPQNAEAVWVELQEGKTTPITLKVHQGRTITGTLIDDAGKPALGVYSFLCNPNQGDTTHRSGIYISFSHRSARPFRGCRPAGTAKEPSTG